MSDAEYLQRCEAMRIGSANLLEAITAARAGTCVVTPSRPLKLPPDAHPIKPVASKSVVPASRPETQEETVLRLFAKGQSEKTIARNMGLANHQVVQGILGRVKRSAPSIYWRAFDRHMVARGVTR